MTVEQAVAWVAERTGAIGEPLEGARHRVAFTGTSDEAVRLLLSGLDLGGEFEAVVDGLGAASRNAARLLAECPFGSEVGSLRMTLAQSFVMGFLLGQGDES